jgi:membrane-bound metal-dependent hydrolase YbcI (DUF457 family)
MLNSTHCASAAVAFEAAGGLVWHLPPLALAAGVVVAYGAGGQPDIDQQGSDAARSFGPVTAVVSWLVHRLGRGHRGDTHTAIGDLVCAGLGAVAVAFRTHPAGQIALGLYLALLLGTGAKAAHLFRHNLARETAALVVAGLMAWTGFGSAEIAPAILVGTVAHCAGDGLTLSGVAWLRPFSEHKLHMLPPWLRITTGHFTEKVIIRGGLLAAFAWTTWIMARGVHIPHVTPATIGDLIHHGLTVANHRVKGR